MRQLAHAEVVDEEQKDGPEVSEVGLAGTVQGCVGEFPKEGVGLAGMGGPGSGRACISSTGAGSVAPSGTARSC